MKKSQPLKYGEKVLFLIFAVFLVFAVIAYAMMEGVRYFSGKQMYAISTHFDLSAIGKEGSKIYREARCNSCHRVMRSGTSMGLSLDGIGSKRDYRWIMDFLKNPEQVYPGQKTLDHGLGKEAAYVLSLPESDLVAIATFLSEIKADQGSAVSPVPPKGDSPFIDSMVNMWAPQSWKEKYTDIREKDQTQGQIQQQPLVQPGGGIP